MRDVKFVQNKVMSLTTKTWCKDLNGLFDYESSQFISNEFEIEEKTILSRYKSEVFAIKVGISEPQDLHDAGFLIKVDLVDENSNKIKKSKEKINNLTNNENFLDLIEKNFNEVFSDYNLTNDKYSSSSNIFRLSNLIPRNLIPNKSNIKLLEDKIWHVMNKEAGHIEEVEREGEGKFSPQLQEAKIEGFDYKLLEKNDIIKLGRIMFSVIDLRIVNQENNELSHQIPTSAVDKNIHHVDNTNNISCLNSNIPIYENIVNSSVWKTQDQPVFNLIYSAHSPNQEEAAECKICFSAYQDEYEHNDSSNPMIALCKCTGGLKYAHYKCLHKWIATKSQIIRKENRTVTSYNLKHFNCEICKEEYPCKICLFYSRI
jgi:hypothetical protein